MSKPGVVALGLLAIALGASCATGSRSAETRSEPHRVVDPSAGTVTYKGRTIVFDEAARPPLLAIDGTAINVYPYGTGQHAMYTISAMPYATFGSVWGAAKALVDSGMIEHPTGH